jgi:hypothetical protein
MMLTRAYIIRIQSLTLHVSSKKSHFCQNYFIKQGTGHYTSTSTLGIHIPREKVKGLYNCLCSNLWVSHSTAADYDSLLGCGNVSLGVSKNHCAITFKDYAIHTHTHTFGTVHFLCTPWTPNVHICEPLRVNTLYILLALHSTMFNSTTNC